MQRRDIRSNPPFIRQPFRHTSSPYTCSAHSSSCISRSSNYSINSWSSNFKLQKRKRRDNSLRTLRSALPRPQPLIVSTTVRNVQASHCETIRSFLPLHRRAVSSSQLKLQIACMQFEHAWQS